MEDKNSQSYKRRLARRNDKRRERYRTDPEYRDLCRAKSREYSRNRTPEQAAIDRARRSAYASQRWREIKEERHVERERKRERKREQAIAEYEQRQREKEELREQRQREKYRKDQERLKWRYHNEPGYKEKCQKYAREYKAKIKADPVLSMRQKVIHRRYRLRKRGIFPTISINEEVRQRLEQEQNNKQQQPT